LVTKFPEDFLEVPSGWRIAEGDADDLRVCATHPWQVRLILRVLFAPEFDLFLFCRSRSTRWWQYALVEDDVRRAQLPANQHHRERTHEAA
jgi:hypothetical protein